MAAADALIAMTAQCRGAAADDGIEHLAMRPCKMRLLLFPETVARSTDDVGRLEGGPAHRFISLLDRFTVSVWSWPFLWVGVRVMYPHSVMWIHSSGVIALAGQR